MATPILSANFDKGVTNYKQIFPDLFAEQTASSPLLQRIGIDRNTENAQTESRRGIQLGGSVMNRGAESAAFYARVRDYQQNLVNEIPYQRGYAYNPQQTSLWGAGQEYSSAASLADRAAEDVRRNVEFHVVAEAFAKAPTIQRSNNSTAYALNPASNSDTISDYLLDSGEFVRQDAQKGDNDPIDICSSSRVMTHIAKSTRHYDNSYSAMTQGGTINKNTYGGMMHSTYATPVKFTVTVDSANLAAGDKLKFFAYHGHFVIEIVAAGTTITKDDVNKVVAGSSAQNTAINLARFFQADNGVFDADRFSRKSFIYEDDSATALQDGNTFAYQTFRVSNELSFAVTDSSGDFDMLETDLTSIDVTSASFDVVAFGVNTVNSTSTQIAGAASKVAVSAIQYGLLFVCAPCVDYKMQNDSAMLTEVPSQGGEAGEDNLIIRKGNMYGLFGLELFADKMFYVKKDWVTLA